jgi:hypothetical protein
MAGLPAQVLPISSRSPSALSSGSCASISRCGRRRSSLLGSNREKLDYDEPTLPLLDPLMDEPAEHLAFYGPMILHRTGCDRGDITVRRLKLNERSSLFERRKERLEQIQGLLDRIALMVDGPLKTALEQAVEDEAADDEPYAAVVRAFMLQARDEAS